MLGWIEFSCRKFYSSFTCKFCIREKARNPLILCHVHKQSTVVLHDSLQDAFSCFDEKRFLSTLYDEKTRPKN